MFGLTGNNPANDPDKKPIKQHSKFKPNYSLYSTMLYGRNTPFFAMEVVADDKVNLRVNADVDTLNLSSPLMFPVKMYHDHFFVPLRAILPENADLLVTNPLTGDDIVPEDVNAVLDTLALAEYLQVFHGGSSAFGKACANTSITNPVYWWADFLAHFFTTKQHLDMFCSTNSLLNVLGHNVQDWMFTSYTDPDTGKKYGYDYQCEAILNIIRNEVKSFDVKFVKVTASGGSYSYGPGSSITVNMQVPKVQDTSLTATIGYRQFLRLLSEGNPIYQINGVVLTSAGTTAARTSLNWSAIFPNISPDASFDWAVPTKSTLTPIVGKHRYVNVQRLIAYQLCNASFYTNDGVDYVYSADLYHQNQMSLIQQITTSSIYTNTYGTYMLNGVTMRCDSCSGKLVRNMLSRAAQNGPINTTLGTSGTQSVWSDSKYSMVLPWLCNMYGYQRSLKYRDYFVGSKVRPLAVGDVTVNVSSNMVNVVDITRNIMRQRFFNQVNRLGRSLKEYSRGIFGVTPMPDPREPILLASTCDVMGASETDSTDPSANLAQGQTTSSKFRNSSSKYAFEITPNEFGILIGICHFDAIRPYTGSTDRQFYHMDRFDMFNPYMQNVGDQEVALAEVYNHFTTANLNKSFGYQLRYAEYKQRVDRAVGAFATDKLPGYAFPMLPSDLFELDGKTTGVLELNPDFIRARSEDFDQFFSELPFLAEGNYFHFIARHDAEVDAVRPMESAPTIL